MFPAKIELSDPHVLPQTGTPEFHSAGRAKAESPETDMKISILSAPRKLAPMCAGETVRLRNTAIAVDAIPDTSRLVAGWGVRVSLEDRKNLSSHILTTRQAYQKLCNTPNNHPSSRENHS